ncbi:PDGLE domain-containing protein [Frankia sp. Cpl3]|nr:PDGLE domain-containing protein [Frankia sp. Cpl3]
MTRPNSADHSVPPSPTQDGAGPGRRHRRNTVFVVAGLFVAFVLAGFVSGYSSSHPDGLEKVAEDKGFIQQAEDHSFADWPLADYAVSGIGDERLAGGVAGVIGVSITFLVGVVFVGGIMRLRTRSRVGATEGDRVMEAAGAGPRP